MGLTVLTSILVYACTSASAESIPIDEESSLTSNAESTSMFQPVPASLSSFEITAEGMSITKRDGRDGPLTDASINISGSVVTEEADYSRFKAAGTIVLADQQKLEITEMQGTILFFKDTRGNSIAGLVNIVGNHSLDENGNDLGKLRLRALVFDGVQSESWPITVHPSGRIGDQLLLVGMDGTIAPK
jgi:hypothetical protein